jgi:hypothetical protein
MSAPVRGSGKYQIDRSILLQKVYYLLCFFFANKEIARRTEPHELLALLEQRLFESEASRALIELAVGMRVIDDQMKKLSSDNSKLKAYRHRLITANALADARFNSSDKPTTFREMCNKIIHSDVLEPHLDVGSEPHQHYDTQSRREWTHLSCYVRLSGRRGREEWNFLLAIDDFVKAVCVLLIEPDRPANPALRAS